MIFSHRISIPGFYKFKIASFHSEKRSPVIHEVKIQTRYFNFIKAGQKKVEGKIHNKKYAAVEQGDFLQFQDTSHSNQILLCEVISKAVYPSFKAMLESEGLALCLPHVKTIEEGVQVYHSFPGYEKDSKVFQVVAFKIRCMTKPDYITLP